MGGWYCEAKKTRDEGESVVTCSSDVPVAASIHVVERVQTLSYCIDLSSLTSVSVLATLALCSSGLFRTCPMSLLIWMKSLLETIERLAYR